MVMLKVVAFVLSRCFFRGVDFQGNIFKRCHRSVKRDTNPNNQPHVRLGKATIPLKQQGLNVLGASVGTAQYKRQHPDLNRPQRTRSAAATPRRPRGFMVVVAPLHQVQLPTTDAVAKIATHHEPSCCSSIPKCAVCKTRFAHLASILSTCMNPRGKPAVTVETYGHHIARR